MNRPADLILPESSKPARFTVEQFLRMFEADVFEDRPMELVDGEIIELSPGHSRHGQLHTEIIVQLAKLVGSKRIFTDAFLRLDETNLRAFDATVIQPDLAPGKVILPVEVLLGVEVSDSTLDRDLGEKLDQYAAAGIPHYLVVDVQGERLLLMTDLAEGAYARTVERAFGEPLDLPGDLGTLVLD